MLPVLPKLCYSRCLKVDNYCMSHHVGHHFVFIDMALAVWSKGLVRILTILVLEGGYPLSPLACSNLIFPSLI